jgi:low affinity Fe/Cu permease
MPRKRRSSLARTLEAWSTAVTGWTGSAAGFGVAALVVIVWAVTGPLFGFSNTWQLVINTGTTIVTFLMVFLIQRAQNKEAMALQLKLNEIIAALPVASNRMVDIEDLEEDELATLHEFYAALSQLARKRQKVTESHSIAEAEQASAWKARRGRARRPRVASRG